jgi:hypothetical protein
MKVINKIIFVAALAISVLSTEADAGLIFDANNQVAGANNVIVNGIAYDVVFTDTQSCNDIYTCSILNNNFPFQPNLDTTLSSPNWDDSGAEAAGNALLLMFEAATNVNGMNYNADPTLINGCDNYWLCEILIPWRVRGGDGLFDGVRAINHRNINQNYINSNTLSAFDVDGSFAGNGQMVLAGFTVASASTPVPSPSSMSLLLLGVFSYIIRRRRNVKA